MSPSCPTSDGCVRGWLILPVLCLAACKPAAEGDAASPATGGPATSAQRSSLMPDRIACALGGARDFATQCDVERVWQDRKPVLVVHHPDGGFRRFEVVHDGRGMIAADGAHSAQIDLRGGDVEVTVGADRYRFPNAESQADAAH